jgi:hypothetical protein
MLDNGDNYKVERAVDESLEHVIERISLKLLISFKIPPRYRRIYQDFSLYTCVVNGDMSSFTSTVMLPQINPELSKMLGNLDKSDMETKASMISPDSIKYENTVLGVTIAVKAVFNGVDLQIVQVIDDKINSASSKGKSLEEAFNILIHGSEFKTFEFIEKIRSWFVSKFSIVKKELSNPLRVMVENPPKPNLTLLAKDLDLNTIQWRPIDIEVDLSGNAFVGILHSGKHLYFKLSSLNEEEEILLNQWLQRLTIVKVCWDLTLELKILPKLRSCIDLQLIYSTGGLRKSLGTNKALSLVTKNLEDLKAIESKYAAMLGPLY